MGFGALEPCEECGGQLAYRSMELLDIRYTEIKLKQKFVLYG